MDVAPTSLDPGERHRLVSAAVSPRPVGWISTVAPEGRDNLAPYSQVAPVASSPPTLAVGTAHREDGRRKDTARFALATGEFVLNVVTEPLLESVTETSLPAEGSEFDAAGLERAPAAAVAPPRVAAAPAHLECSLREHLPVGENTLLLGDVEHVHVDDEYVADGAVDARALGAVGRLVEPYFARPDPVECPVPEG